MNLEIFPYDGVGPIKLGMTQAEIREVIGGDYRSFMKSPFDKLPTDNFIGKGIHVSYRAPDICDTIELHPPSVPTFRGYRLIGIPFDQLAKYFQQEDPSLAMEDYGLTSRRFGLDLYVPELDEGPEAPVKAVLVFEKGYHDREPLTM